MCSVSVEDIRVKSWYLSLIEENLVGVKAVVAFNMLQADDVQQLLTFGSKHQVA